jgi:uncharacterized membrane protein
MRVIKFFLFFLIIFHVSYLFADDSLKTQQIADTLITKLDSPAVSDEPSLSIVTVEPSYVEKLIGHRLSPVMLLLLVLLGLIYWPFRRGAAGIRNILRLENTLSKVEIFDYEEKLSQYKATLRVISFISPILLIGFLVYVAVENTIMQGYIVEWLNLLVRWAHVVAGIMWIGASFYFIFLENNLNRTKNIREELAGDLWAVHGGGFYYLEKYKIAPKQLPADLHWFKYEAYFTFITGFLLLIVVYYLNARAYLIDVSVADISVPLAILISVISFGISWVVYDFLCKSSLQKSPWLFTLVTISLLIGLAFFLTHVFNSRAAFIHVGGIMGAIMVANVFFNIIPAQKAMVRSATIGEPLDTSLGKKAGQRSLHNNYFTLPVIFIMISNHFPSTFGHEYNWIVLAIISLASVGIKHYWNLLERGVVRTKILIASIIAIVSLALIISPAFEAQMDKAVPVSFSEVDKIIKARCVQCHSASPTDDVWKVAPNGVTYDTPEEIKNRSAQILARAVRSKTMPQGNKTNMTDAERLVLRRWIVQGSKIDVN